MKIRLSAGERAAVAPLEARLSERARFSITLDGLLSDWEAFVKQVEEGYPSGVDEYTNDLSARDLLEEILLSISGPPKRRLARLIRPLDDRFKAATCPDDGRLLSRFLDLPDRWWWSRIPGKLAGELASSIG